MKYRMRRAGKFDVRLAQGNQCGMAGDLDFRYEFMLVADTLDHRAFLIDHHAVDSIIQGFSRAGVYRGSCEQLAVSLAALVATRLKQEIPGGGELTFKLSGSDVADITVIGSVIKADASEFHQITPRFKLVEVVDAEWVKNKLPERIVDNAVGEAFVELKKGQANKKKFTKLVPA